jgi:hypothetical protein
VIEDKKGSRKKVVKGLGRSREKSRKSADRLQEQSDKEQRIQSGRRGRKRGAGSDVVRGSRVVRAVGIVSGVSAMKARPEMLQGIEQKA